MKLELLGKSAHMLRKITQNLERRKKKDWFLSMSCWSTNRSAQRILNYLGQGFYIGTALRFWPG